MKHLLTRSNILFTLCLVWSSILHSQSVFQASRSSVLLSNAQSGASERWISLSAPSSLTTNYRLFFPTTAPSLNQQMVVSSISGSDYSMDWTNATNITGSGTATQVAFWTGTSTLSSSSSLFWDNTNKRLGVNTSSPQARIHSVVTSNSSALLSLAASNRAFLAENTTNGGVVGIQFRSRNAGGTLKTMNLGVDPTMIGGNGAFGMLPDGVSDGGMLIDLVSGHVLIGSTVSGSSLPNKLAVNGNCSIGSGYRENSAPSDGLIVQGWVGIGTNSPGDQLQVYNGTSTGTYTTSGWTHSSDRRLKTNIEPLHNALATVRQLQGVSFQWKNLPSERRQIGFIAQDVEAVLPEVVSTDANGQKAMAYQNLTALHNEAIKELDQRLSNIENGMAAATSNSSGAQYSALGAVQILRKTSDESVISGKAQSDDELVLSIPEGQIAEVEYNLVVECPSNEISIQFEGMQSESPQLFAEWSSTQSSGSAWIEMSATGGKLRGAFAHQKIMLSLKGVCSSKNTALNAHLQLGSTKSSAQPLVIHSSSTLKTTRLQ